MQNFADTETLLNLKITLSVSPEVSFENEGRATTPPDNRLATGTGEFLLSADAAIGYASLSRILNGYLAGKRFELSEGLFARHVVVKDVAVSGGPAKALMLKVSFTGSFQGTAIFTGIPVYNEETNTIVLLHLRYDLQTASLLLKGAEWLFASRIEKELKKAASIPVGPLLTQMQKALSNSLNQEWTKGVRSFGEGKMLRLSSVEALPEHLAVRASCQGSLRLVVSEIALNFKG